MGHAMNRRGLTFVELLVAATMLAVLIGGLAGHLRGGLAVWQRASAQMDTAQRRRVAWERLERDLRNALRYDERPDAYGPQEGALPLPLFEAGGLAWFTLAAPGPGEAPAVQYVTYGCGDVGATAGLWRTSLGAAAARAKQVQPAAELVLPECEVLSVEYAFRPQDASQPLAWRSQWLEPLQLPQLVRVSLLLASGEQVQRTMAIPRGVLGDG
ncbi:MAG: prepilin-type N-terminal cleavage/methylation domain-containing protein [Candidatus Omnitrophica bacterium]|nr:prepilin-type N-terminal cleavage/methylation domain-containing protein [Candidatus Omnitrophota bacterium]